MKTIYKGVLTVATATVIASATIMITGAETKPDQGVVASSEKESKINTAENNVANGTTEDIKGTANVKGADAKAIVKTTEAGSYPAPPPGPFSVKKEKPVNVEATIIEKPTAPAKPTEMSVAPTAPVAPTAVTIDNAVTAKSTEVLPEKSKTAETNAIANPVISDTSIKVPEAPKAVEFKEKAPTVATTEAPALEIPTAAELKEKAPAVATIETPAPETPTAIELKEKAPAVATTEVPAPETPTATELKAKAPAVVTTEVPAPETPTATELKAKAPAVVTTEIQAPKTPTAIELNTKAPAVATIEVPVPEKPTVTELKQPDAPVVMQTLQKPTIVEPKQPDAPVIIDAPKQPKTTILKAPETLTTDGSFAKPNQVPQEQSNTTTGKQAVPSQPAMPLVSGQQQQHQQQGQQPVSTVPSSNNAKPQAMPMMVPPTMVMPQGMVPPTIMMPPQMMNRQGVIMVPVYPMHMGRPMYPQGYPVPPAGMKPPQGSIQHQQAQPAVATPNQQQEKAPADNVGK